VLLSTACWLVLIDVGVGLLCRPDPNPQHEPKGLARYFQYGRSVESKLRYMVRDTPETSAPVASAGWLATVEGVLQPVHRERTHPSDANHMLIAVYGQSFSLRATNAIAEVDPTIETRFLGGPAAPLSHSFAVFEGDRGKHQAKVVTIGVLASTLSRLTSLTNMTLWFEEPQPLTYPRYFLENGELRAIQPLVQSFDELRDTLRDPVRWKQFTTQLSRHDAAYDPYVFERDVFDYSTLGRAVRRAYGQRHAREFASRYLDKNGFTQQDQIVDVAAAILAKFAQDATADGRMPYVLLFNDSGQGNHLPRALGPHLDRLGIAYLSSDSVIAPNDPANYEANGHFRPDLDRAFAEAWRDDLHRRLDPDGERHAMLGGNAEPSK
jgi:hypothetical protein